MPSDARRNAGKENGKRGAGKHTAAGKARSALNALKHGLTATTATAGLLCGEDPDAYDRHLQSHLALFNPADDFELACVLRIVSGLWRLQRLAAAETGALELALQATAPEIEKQYEHADVVVRFGAAFTHFSAEGTMANFARYEATLSRSVTRARRDLEEYRRNPPSQNPNLQNEGNGTAEAPADPAVYSVLDAPPPMLHARVRHSPAAASAGPPTPMPIRVMAVHQTLPASTLCPASPPLSPPLEYAEPGAQSC